MSRKTWPLTALAVLAACAQLQTTPHEAPKPELRWIANLAAPAGPAGGARMNGSASMAPGPDGTSVSITVANGVPGSVHAWGVHHGQCGADKGVVGSSDAYKSITVGADGRAMSAANIFFMTPASGEYFVIVQTSAANSTSVACGNLAPPAT